MAELLSAFVCAAVLGWSGWMLRGQFRQLGHVISAQSEALSSQTADAKAERELLLAAMERLTNGQAGAETRAVEVVLERLGYGASGVDEPESVTQITEDDEIRESRAAAAAEVEAELAAMARALGAED